MYSEDSRFSTSRRDDPAWLAWTKLREEEGKMIAFKEPVSEKWWPDLTKKYEDLVADAAAKKSSEILEE